VKADTKTLKEILYGDKRFVIPVYQRPHVWEKERQWEPLWADIEATARRLLEVRRSAHLHGVSASEADRRAAPHFLGAVVIEQHLTPTGDVEVRSVVDGQQRLTTLQLLLRGVLDALENANVDPRISTRLRKLVLNDDEVLTGDLLFKVWPRPAEQRAFVEAMSATPPDEAVSVFAAARNYFAASAMEFMQDATLGEDPYATDEQLGHGRAALLVATLQGLVKIVIIDLEDVDDAQVIFEALNARNTPLSATDLVKNLIFLRAQSQGADPEVLYERIWARFDRDSEWWRANVGAGHAQRPRQDWLLGDWLIAERGRAINVGRLYGEFRSWLDESGIAPANALETLARYATAYEQLHGRVPGASPAEAEAFRRIERLGITVATPVLLWLLVQPEGSARERERAFRAIESYVIRRMAAKWQTRGYGAVFVEVLKAARDAPENPGRAVVEALRAGPTGYIWPTDADLSYAFANQRFYGPGGINQERLRLLLGAADRQAQQEYHMGEGVSVRYADLTIEHVLPQAWRENWPVPAADPAEQQELERRRDVSVNQIGNLTLVSERLNPHMSNGAWAIKRPALARHSSLRLNARICHEDEWNEEKIAHRSQWLLSMLSREWPGPEAWA
jgi:hypothetical protein